MIFFFVITLFQVTQLSYLAKKSLSSTVRQITSRLISDTVLQEFSYIGQKKKKIFNKLLICNLIIGELLLKIYTQCYFD